MEHNKEFLKKYVTEKYGIVKVMDKLHFNPREKEPRTEGLWYKVQLFNNHYEYVEQKDLKQLKYDN